MRQILTQGDKVKYKTGDKKMRGTVADVLPFHPQNFVPILKRTKIVWMERTEVRKLPKQNEENDIPE
jgi:hypothetical protein